jgi:hypothetical protein
MVSGGEGQNDARRMGLAQITKVSSASVVPSQDDRR